jgi:hypothetical protein
MVGASEINRTIIEGTVTNAASSINDDKNSIGTILKHITCPTSDHSYVTPTILRKGISCDLFLAINVDDLFLFHYFSESVEQLSNNIYIGNSDLQRASNTFPHHLLNALAQASELAFCFKSMPAKNEAEKSEAYMAMLSPQELLSIDNKMQLALTIILPRLDGFQNSISNIDDEVITALVEKKMLILQNDLIAFGDSTYTSILTSSKPFVTLPGIEMAPKSRTGIFVMNKVAKEEDDPGSANSLVVAAGLVAGIDNICVDTRGFIDGQSVGNSISILDPNVLIPALLKLSKGDSIENKNTRSRKF